MDDLAEDVVDDDYFDQDDDADVDEEALQNLLANAENRELLKRWAGMPLGTETENTMGMTNLEEEEADNVGPLNEDSDEEDKEKRASNRTDLNKFQDINEAYTETGQMDKLT